MSAGFRYAWMTPETVERDYRGGTAFIEMSGPYAIYYHEPTQSFRVHGTGAIEIIDRETAERDLAELRRALERARELDRSRGIGAAVATKLETIVRKFGQTPPPVPDILPDYLDLAPDALIRPGEKMGLGGMLGYNEATQRFWVQGATALGADALHFELERIEQTVERALEIDEQRRAEGLVDAQAVQARFHVPYESERD
jgi:hypothetical protein